jgi:hypothetical protein
VFVFTLSLPVLSLTLRRSSHPFSARLFQCVTTPTTTHSKRPSIRWLSSSALPRVTIVRRLRWSAISARARTSVKSATTPQKTIAKKGQSSPGTFRVTGSTIAPSVVVSLVCISWPITSPFGTAD